MGSFTIFVAVISIFMIALTNGEVYFASGSDLSSSLIDAFDAGIDHGNAVRLYSRYHVVGPTLSPCVDIPIDPTLGANTTFAFQWNEPRVGVSVQINEPNASQRVLNPSVNQTTAVYRNDRHATGVYTICLSCQQLAGIHIGAKSAPSNETTNPPIKITSLSQIEPNNVSFNDVRAAKDYIKVYIVLRISRIYPVINANVTCRYEEPDSMQYYDVQLRDDGRGSDFEVNDGTYTITIYSTRVTGKHSISCWARGTNSTKLVNGSAYEATFPVTTSLIGGNSGVTAPKKPDPAITYPFVRFVLLGFFEVTSISASDNISPGDISITSGILDGNLITIGFTAVGDDFLTGTADHYIIRWATTLENIRNSVNVTEITDQDIVQYSGLSNPLPSGGTERISIFFNMTGVVLLTIASVDEAGNVGRESFHLTRIISTYKYTSVQDARLKLGIPTVNLTSIQTSTVSTTTVEYTPVTSTTSATSGANGTTINGASSSTSNSSILLTPVANQGLSTASATSGANGIKINGVSSFTSDSWIMLAPVGNESLSTSSTTSGANGTTTNGASSSTSNPLILLPTITPPIRLEVIPIVYLVSEIFANMLE